MTLAAAYMHPYIVDFRSVRDVRALSKVIGTDEPRIERVLARDGTLVQRHLIPKRDPKRGAREVWEIVDNAVLDGFRALSHRLHDFAAADKRGYPHAAAHAYLPRRSTVTNAGIHVGSQRLTHADIKSFFPSISTARVESFLLSWKFPPESAALLARFCTLEQGLPLGFPTSPVLANMLCTSLDVDFAALAANKSCRYTRYADDICFSGDTEMPTRIEIASILDRHRFTISDDKFHEAVRGQAFFVTGLSVSEKDAPRAPRAFKKRLRQELYYVEKFGLHSHLDQRGYNTYQSGINQIDGRMRYLQGIERQLALKMRARWYAALDAAGASVSHVSRGGAPLPRVGLYIDESEPENSGLLLVGCVVVEEVDKVRGQLAAFLADKLGDPFVAGRKEKLAKKGLHWADIHEEVKSELVAFVSRLPFRAFIAFEPLGEYEATYLELTHALLRRRFVALDGRIVDVVAEQNAKVSQEKLRRVIESVEAPLIARSARRPHSWTYTSGQKLGEPCLALVDVILGVVGDFIANKPAMGTVLALRYERIKSKIRVIESLADKRVFTRRNPFTL